MQKNTKYPGIEEIYITFFIFPEIKILYFIVGEMIGFVL